MKRKRHICAVLLCALVLAGLFTACGSSSNTAAADSAGSIMTTEYVDLRKNMTVAQAMAHIKETD